MRIIILGLLLAGVVGLACGDNGESVDAPDVAEPEATVDPATAAIIDEAKSFCPLLDDEFSESCVTAYLLVSQAERPAILCVDDGQGTWYFATPGATPEPGQVGNEASRVGDDCREPGHSAVVLVGG